MNISLTDTVHSETCKKTIKQDHGRQLLALTASYWCTNNVMGKSEHRKLMKKAGQFKAVTSCTR